MQSEAQVSPPPIARTTVKALKMTQTMPVVLTNAVLTCSLRRHKQWHYLSAASMNA